MAVVDADYCFISADIGSSGSVSDSYVFQRSNFGRRLQESETRAPENQQLPNDTGPAMPFVFIRDEAFAWSEHLLRPYGRKNLNFMKRIFNYQLTRARRMVACAFGIMANKWRILHRPLDVNLEFCDSIIKACGILHNYVHLRDGVNYEHTLHECPLPNINPTIERGSHVGATTRDYFAKYFTSPQGSVAWQYEKI
jgi:hypothetical protein